MSSALSFTLDTTAPVVAITSAGGPTKPGGADHYRHGRRRRRRRYRHHSSMAPPPIGSAIVQSDGTWSSSVTLSNGSNALTAQVTDVAGNLPAPVRLSSYV